MQSSPFTPVAGGPSGRCGFTLIELLTVIAIIGILAAILIPVVGKVRASARESSSRSQLRQIVLAAQTHDADRKKVPPMWEPGITNLWAELYPYIGGSRVVEPKGPGSPFVSPAVTVPVDGNVTNTYNVNMLLAGFPTLSAWRPPVRSFSKVARPSRTVYVGEGVQFAAGNSSYYSNNTVNFGSGADTVDLAAIVPRADVIWEGGEPAPNDTHRFVARQGDKVNFAMVDGSTRAIAVSEFNYGYLVPFR